MIDVYKDPVEVFPFLIEKEEQSLCEKNTYLPTWNEQTGEICGWSCSSNKYLSWVDVESTSFSFAVKVAYHKNISVNIYE